MSTLNRLRDLIEPIVDDRGLELYDLDFTGGKLVVTVDRPPGDPAGAEGPEQHGGGVDIDVIAAVTRAVSRALDEHDPIPSTYSLEVTSPGLERVLRTPLHFQRAVGQEVSVKTTPGHELGRRLRGQLVRAGDPGDPDPAVAGSVELELTEPPGVVTVAYDDIEKARTVFVWGPQPKPGAKPTPHDEHAQKSKKKKVSAR